MNGPDHYRKAGELLDRAGQTPGALADQLIAAALVHAQLAGVAVAALSARSALSLPDEDYEAWDLAAGVQVEDLDDDELTVVGGLD